MVVAAEETRKGPWTEEEDMKLVCFVGLFGERRWDFIAKVSGLKRGRMSPQEERLILELHARWGNRWSRIARKLPGRTDNEIKNYWRTHMRKKAQERKRNGLSSSSSSSSLSSSSTLSFEALPAETYTPKIDASQLNTTDAAATELGGSWAMASTVSADGLDDGAYPMEQIWNDIASSSEESGVPPPAASSPLWEYYVDPLWKMEDAEVVHGQHQWWGSL